MPEPIIATDETGCEVYIYLMESGEIILRWLGGSKIRLTREQSHVFAKAAIHAAETGKPLTITVSDWVH